MINGKDLGWCWGPEWKVKLIHDLLPGEYEVEVRLNLSTYNMYGPHCHIDGDRHLTSPAQYEGIKNFADWTDSPEITKGEAWHFVRFGIKGDIKIAKVL